MYISRRKHAFSTAGRTVQTPDPNHGSYARSVRSGLRVGVSPARQYSLVCVLPNIHILADLEHKIRGETNFICFPDRVLEAMFLVTYKS